MAPGSRSQTFPQPARQVSSHILSRDQHPTALRGFEVSLAQRASHVQPQVIRLGRVRFPVTHHHGTWLWHRCQASALCNSSRDFVLSFSAEKTAEQKVTPRKDHFKDRLS